MKRKFFSHFLAGFLLSIIAYIPITALASDLNRASLKEIEEMPMPDYEFQIKETVLPEFVIDAIESIQLFFGATPEKYRVASISLTQEQLQEQLLQRVDNSKKLKQDIESYSHRMTSDSQLPNIFLKPTSHRGQQLVYLARHREDERMRTDRKNYSGKTVTSHGDFSGQLGESFANKRYPNREGELEEAVLKNGFH